jgi:hypothetical protein
VAAPNFKKRGLFPTALTMFWNKCPKQFEFRYIQDIREPPNAAMYQGTTYHGALEENFKQKLTTREDLSTEAVRQIAAERWENRWLNEPPQLKEGEERGALKDQAIQLVTVYHEAVAPEVQPAQIEQRFQCEIDGAPYPLSGRVDLVDQDGIIVDHKTSSKKWSEYEASGNVQLNAYEYGRRTLTGETDTLGVQVQVAVKKKDPEIQRIALPKTEADMDGFENVHRFVSESIERGDFPPRTEGWWCSQAWCGYWNRCPYGARQAVVFATPDTEEEEASDATGSA